MKALINKTFYKVKENFIKAKDWFNAKITPTALSIYPVFAFFISIILFAIIFKLNQIFPYGSLTVSWCDMTQQTIPLLCDFKDVLSGKSSLWLSLENAGGMNFFGVYFFNLSSPFTYIIAFFDKSQMSVAVNIMVALKLSLASATMAYWLKKEVEGINPIVSISLGILYGFSGWAMMYYQILSWLDTLYVFPLLLVGLKFLTEGKSPVLYILSLFACLLFHFYLSWVVVVFICFYASVHLLIKRDKTDAFAKKFILSSAISALISALVIIPAFIQYTKSMRVSSVFDTLKNSNFFPRVDTSFPTFFCVLPLLPFLIKAMRSKVVDKFEVLLLLTFVPVMVEPIAKAWQTYNYMSFPTRYGFTTIAMAITIAARGITEVCATKDESKGKLRFIIKTIVSLLAIALVYLFGWYSKKYYDKNSEVITKYAHSLWGNSASFNALFSYYALAVVVALALFFAIKYKAIHKIAFYVAIALMCLVEVGFSSSVYMVSPANENNNFTKAIELDGLIEDDDFYRVKLSRKLFEVNLVGGMGYNSLSHYTSLTRESYMMTIKELGYSSYWMEVGSNGGTIFTDALLRQKYVINSGKKSSEYNTKDYYITKNDLLFPTAFIVPKAGENDGNTELERWQIQNELFKRLTGQGDIYQEYEYTSIKGLEDYSGKKSAKAKTDLRKTSSTMQLTYKVRAVGEQAFYFDCFDVYSNSLKEHTYESVKSISIKGNGKSYSYSTYPKQNQNGVLELGTFEDCDVTVTVSLNGDVYARSFGLFSVDATKLQSAISGVNGGSFTVKKDKLRGTVTTKSGDALFTSFAYDEGYKIKINGKKAKTFSLNGFLAIELNEGENVITMGFIPSGLILAIIVFAIGVLALIAFVVFNKYVEQFKALDDVCYFAVIALGAFVFVAIYLMPLVVNFLGYL